MTRGAKIVNDLTGEALLTDDAGREYHLVFDLQAVMNVEALSGHAPLQVMGNPSVTDCVSMIVAGSAGYQRRSPGGKKVDGKLAMRILIDSGGYRRLAPVLAMSMSCAEGLGLDDDGSDDSDGDEAGPLALPT